MMTNPITAVGRMGMGVLGEALDLPIDPQDTIKAENIRKIADEEERRTGVPMTQRRLREIGEELYKLPPGMRGLAEELFYLGIPEFRTISAALKSPKFLRRFQTAGKAAGKAPFPATGGVPMTDMGPTVFHGTRGGKIESFLDADGNLVLQPSTNFEGRQVGVSFTGDRATAQDYATRFSAGEAGGAIAARRQHGGFIFEIDRDAIPDELFMEAADELATRSTNPVVIPKGKFKVSSVDEEAQSALQAFEREGQSGVRALSNSELGAKDLHSTIRGEMAEHLAGGEYSGWFPYEGRSLTQKQLDITDRFGFEAVDDSLAPFVGPEILRRMEGMSPDELTKFFKELAEGAKALKPKDRNAPFFYGPDFETHFRKTYGDDIAVPAPSQAPSPGTGGVPFGGGGKGAELALPEKARVASSLSGGGTFEAGLKGAVSVHADEISEAALNHFNKVHGTNWTVKDIADQGSLKALKASDAEHYHASPVCKNFTKAKILATADPNDLAIARSLARNIREVQPPSISIENVPAYQDTALFKMITKELDDAGYNWDVNIVDAADYGAAQSRRRLIVRAVKEGELPPLPAKTGSADWYSTLEDLIIAEKEAGNVLPLSEAFTGKLPGMPNDEIARINNYISRGLLDPNKPIITMGASASKGVPFARNAGGPAPTLLASEKAVPRIIFPGPGGLKDATAIKVTPEMMRRLMGLPDTYVLPEIGPRGSFGPAKTILGNGVHGKVTENFIQPLVDQTVAGRQAVPDYTDLIAPSQAPSPGTGGIPGIEGGR
jgi:DNA (cytosine-5)-methyltransferase 1